MKIDLITGFLGSGKTTFLKRYADYLLRSGLKIGILENDYGAVNVDVMLLAELEARGCVIETVAGACDRDCHARRFKTKLIAMGMSDLDRVIIEPSGIFDVDEFFDALREEPLDRWYEIGSVITILDARADLPDSPESRWLLASQAAGAGVVVLSKVQTADENAAERKLGELNRAMEQVKCPRRFESVVAKNWDDFTDEDFAAIMNSGYCAADYVKSFSEHEGYSSEYFMDKGFTVESLSAFADEQFSADSGVMRVKGFVRSGDGWLEFNATRSERRVEPVPSGQDVVIVIKVKSEK